MKKRMFIITVCILLVLCLCSCVDKDTKCDECEEEYLNGYENGIEDMFMRMYNATEDFTTLFNGDIWETEHFSLTMYDSINGEEPYISYDIILKNTTIDHCLNYESFFFYVFATYGTTSNYVPYGKMILTEDDFILYGMIDYEGSTDEYLQDNKAKSECHLYSDVQYDNFMIVIATEGALYTAAYYP